MTDFPAGIVTYDASLFRSGVICVHCINYVTAEQQKEMSTNPDTVKFNLFSIFDCFERARREVVQYSAKLEDTDVFGRRIGDSGGENDIS